MTEILQQHPWLPEVIVGVLAVVVTLLVTYLWRRNDKQTKTFDYEILNDVPVFSGDERPASLKVTFEGKEVAAPRITRVRFKNTGKLVIEKSDVLQKYTVNRGAARLLDFRYAADSADTLDELADLHISVELVDDRFEFTSQTVAISPNTLNPGDWFTIQFMYDGGNDEQPLTISRGRIKGETRPSQIIGADKPARKPIAVPIIAVALAGAAGIGIAELTSAFPALGWPVTWAMIGLLLAGGVTVLRDLL